MSDAEKKFAVDISALINQVVAKCVLPIAREIGVSRSSEGLVELSDELTTGYGNKFADVSKQLAVLMLIDIVQDAAKCIKCVFLEGDVGLFDSLDELQASFFSRVDEFLAYSRGLLAVKAQLRIAGNKGGQKRTALGDDTRTKIRDAALAIHAEMGKERASIEIAKEVSREPGTVKRYLTEIFPGESWGRRHNK